MDKIKKKFSSWWQDGVSFKETIALAIIFIFGYLVFFACKKMMGVGLVDLDIEFLKIISTNIVIVLVFYFGGGSVENIIQNFFNTKK